jgi:WS/DGAT/MGAT family acyltransferase
LPLSLLHTGQRALADPGRTLASVRDAVEGLGEAVTAGLFPATATPLNPEIGPHRRFDWTNIDLEAVREVKNRLGGTVNDVVLATVSGAVRRFLKRRGENVQDLTFRSMVPVNVRRDGQHGALGNRVSFLMAQLPIDERDPRRRLERVIETTRQLKDSKQAFGAETLEEISDSTLFSLFIEFARQAAQRLSYNMVVTNVPGPQFPVYLQGARMQAIYPLVPLFMNQALNIALFSYNGGLFWGFNSDWDAVPDLHDFVQAIEQEFTALRRLAADSPVEIVRTEAEKPRATRRSSTRRRTSAA